MSSPETPDAEQQPGTSSALPAEQEASSAGPARSLPAQLSFSSDEIALRDWRLSDAPALASVCGDPDVCRFTGVPWEYSRSAGRAWVEHQIKRRETGDGLVLAITRPGEPRALGMVSLNLDRSSPTNAGLDLWLVPEARGAGLATAAARALCDYGFANLQLERIELAIEPGNAAAVRVAERLGATADGTRTVREPREEVDVEMEIYALASGAPTD